MASTIIPSAVQVATSDNFLSTEQLINMFPDKDPNIYQKRGAPGISSLVRFLGGSRPTMPVSYTHLTLPTNREV